MLTDLSKKQIAAESKESALTAEIERLKKENEEAAARNAALEQKVQEFYPLREELRKTKNELGSLKAKFQKVLDFIESLILIFNQHIDKIQSLPVMLLMVSLDNEKIVSQSLSTTF